MTSSTVPLSHAPNMSISLYVLRCEGDRFYVGKTHNVDVRFKQHAAGAGAAWTTRYPPVCIERTYDNMSPFDEDRITKELMATHGINKVRGGSYVMLDLSAVHVSAIQHELRSAQDLCTRCGRKGHFVRDCYAKTEIVDGQTFAIANMIMNKKNDSNVTAQDSCTRCGRAGHVVRDCYAKTKTKSVAKTTGTSSTELRQTPVDELTTGTSTESRQTPVDVSSTVSWAQRVRQRMRTYVNTVVNVIHTFLTPPYTTTGHIV